MHQKVDTYFKICQIQDPIVIPILKEKKIPFWYDLFIYESESILNPESERFITQQN